MGVSVAQMRKKVNELYGGQFTRIFEMPDRQVMAIYFKKLREGAFDKKPKKKKEKSPRYYQMSIFDYLGED